MFRVLSEDKSSIVYGSTRFDGVRSHFTEMLANKIITGIDVENHDLLVKLFTSVRPDVVVNCVGLVKQLSEANYPLRAIPINTLLPHRLAALCQATSARLVHFSTDCVFSGSKGNYLENDFPDANDLYGRSKLLGEADYPHAITLRTSVIGHELSGHRSLLNWFLVQQGSVNGFSRAIFSGLPTVEMATVVRDIVLPHQELRGVYHLASKPINKFELLQLVAKVYGKAIEIVMDDSVVIDRSLNADRFHDATGYVPPEWPALIQHMYEFK